MERFDPRLKHHIWYEHWHRYHFSLAFVQDKNVCDIACGEGYGSALIASVAKTVIGVDIDKTTIELAQNKYHNFSNLSYISSNALKTNFADNAFDVVISLETLEHLSEHDDLLTEFKRILKPNGLLIISTPDKNTYSSANSGHNHYHEKELTKYEFDNLIDHYFKFNISFGQQFQLLSSIKNIDSKITKKNQTTTYVEKGKEGEIVQNQQITQYLIKICCDDQNKLNNLDLNYSHYFADSKNSLLKHYEQQIQRLLKIDKQNEPLEEIINKQKAIIAHLQARLGY